MKSLLTARQYLHGKRYEHMPLLDDLLLIVALTQIHNFERWSAVFRPDSIDFSFAN